MALFVVAANNGCENAGDYCIALHDERLHNVLVLEVIIVCFAVLAVAEAGEGPLRTRKRGTPKNAIETAWRESFAVKQGKFKLDPSSNDIVHALALNL